MIVSKCGSDCKNEKKIYEKIILKYKNFVDKITSFDWCEVCQNSFMLNKEDNKENFDSLN